MTTKVINAVLDGAPDDLTGSDLVALIVLAALADDSGRCSPSIEQIARRVRVSGRQATKIVTRLIARGLVEAGPRTGGRRCCCGIANTYRLDLAALEAGAGAREAAR